MSPIYFFRIFEESIVVDRLIALGIYFKSKAFGWTFLQIGHLIRLGHLLKKSKNGKRYQASQIFLRIIIFLSNLLSKLITKIFFLLLIKLVPGFKWAFKQP